MFIAISKQRGETWTDKDACKIDQNDQLNYLQS